MATQAITTEQQRGLIRRLRELVARRTNEALALRTRHEDRLADAEQRYRQERAAATSAFEQEHARLIDVYKQAREAVYLKYESGGHAIAQHEEGLAQDAEARLQEYAEDSRTLCDHRCQQIEAKFREQEIVPGQELARLKKLCEQKAHEIRCLVAEAQKVVKRRCRWPEDLGQPPVESPGLEPEQYLARASGQFHRASEKLNQIRQLPLARFVEDGWPVLIFIFSLVVLAYPLWLALGAYGLPMVAVACVGAALLLAVGVSLAIRPVAAARTLRLLPEFQEAVDQANADLKSAVQSGEQAAAKKQRRLVRRRDRHLAAARQELADGIEAQRGEEQRRLEASVSKFAARRRLLEETHEREIQEIEATYPGQIKQLEGHFEQRIIALAESYRVERLTSHQELEHESRQLEMEWTSGMAQIQAAAGAMNAFCTTHFKPWDKIEPPAWQPPSREAGSIPAMCIGSYEVQWKPPEDEGAGPASHSLVVPAVLSYPHCPSLLLEAEGEGRDVATSVLQNVMLRLLTTFPPGKVRFTIVDPVGLGQNFSAFMHLADYDERLVASRIWTESSHINQKLADLTEHMENVIQKYLRNEFASIQEYNEQAGEVAEPFQILVVANFPANFSDEAARRLVSIAASGARCGVYTLISVDMRHKLPRNFELSDLEAHAAVVAWDENTKQFRWKHDDLRDLPLALEMPPDDARFTEMVCAVGRLAKDAARVEVPFEAVVPDQQQWWSADSRSEVIVPLGRAGAKKLQYLRLGKGTSQHVLIAGKTGSGKSTLLNAMITNLAVHYSPAELEFYLIDFKKGVEFKAYAAHRLPHARVIAIESEREFGMSVLERLDQELKRRGDLFRQHGAQDLKGYRNAQPEASMPRILLVIDEFQEFFTSDDRISHDAALLLDRLVRQGRAFGIHVLLGSQTLAGAYTLARSTIGQMAVRIALQCSESDAHLILSEDNTAARLLSRPGEAIYNDANGLLEGNHPFQVVWLSDHDREDYLRRIAEKAARREISTPPTIVFEGNAAADPNENVLLRTVLGKATAGSAAAPRAWLGAAVAIKDPTEVVFRRQGGNNLLIVGQHEEMAIGMLANAVIALAAQTGALAGGNGSPALPRFLVLDGANADSPEAGFWQRMQGRLQLDAEIVTPRDSGSAIRRVNEELERRMAAGEAVSEPVFLVIHNLARFRDLRKSDDFSFNDEQSGSAAKQLATILREGPALGIHVLVWSDSFSNAQRWLDRSSLRDLETRVLFQMSATDSSNLMDGPAASRLGPHLAIQYSEEQGQAEKFRPYGLPSNGWLQWVSQQLALRAGDALPQRVASEQD